MTGNVHPHEIEKFGALASRWWDPNGPQRPLHELNPVRLAYVERWQSLAGAKVLDVGCGGGLLTEAMAHRQAQATGIDLSAQLIDVARLHLLESGIQADYRVIAVETLAEAEPGQYDAITCMEMLEHVPDPASVVRACALLVKPGGWVFFSTLNRNAKSFLFAIVGAEYVLNLLPKGTHEFAKFIRPSELGQYIREAGLSHQASKGLQYNPLTRRYWLDGDTSVNYMMSTRKP